MKVKFSFPILFLVLFSLQVQAQQKGLKPQHAFRVVGYYFLNAATEDTAYSDSDYLFLDKITHLNIAFINPDSTGSFNQNLAIDTLLNKAHLKGVQVLASIAGGGPHPQYKVLLQDTERKRFIVNLVSMMQRYKFDGIDVDLEGGDIDDHYESFVVDLAASLKPLHKLLTAAIATAYKDQLPDKALRQFDFVNVMSYDRTGPWRPSDPGDHAPYAMAVEDLDYWHKVRSIPKEKLGLGLPFYGYGFGAPDSAVSMNYKEIVSLYPDNATDTLHMPENVVMYYNNISTIRKKTSLALEKAGGVMIWQLLGDAEGKTSLLNAVNSVIQQKQNVSR